jgi:hypothetical protein
MAGQAMDQIWGIRFKATLSFAQRALVCSCRKAKGSSRAQIVSFNLRIVAIPRRIAAMPGVRTRRLVKAGERVQHDNPGQAG